MNLDICLFLGNFLQFTYFQNQFEMDWNSKTLITKQSANLEKEMKIFKMSIRRELVM